MIRPAHLTQIREPLLVRPSREQRDPGARLPKRHVVGVILTAVPASHPNQLIAEELVLVVVGDGAFVQRDEDEVAAVR